MLALSSFSNMVPLKKDLLKKYFFFLRKDVVRLLLLFAFGCVLFGSYFAPTFSSLYYNTNDGTDSHLAYAHFIGDTKYVDGYQIIFQTPSLSPSASSNSTSLSFSILKNGSNISNVNVAVTVKAKDTGKLIDQFPYKLYEFSDISIPYMFKENSDYEVTLDAVPSDSRTIHSIVASFDISVGRNTLSFPISDLFFYYILPGIIVSVAALGYRRYEEQKVNKRSNF